MFRRIALLSAGVVLMNIASGCDCYRCYCRQVISSLDRQVFVNAPGAGSAEILLDCDFGEISPGCDPEPCHDGDCLAEETCEPTQTVSLLPTPDPPAVD